MLWNLVCWVDLWRCGWDIVMCSDVVWIVCLYFVCVQGVVWNWCLCIAVYFCSIWEVCKYVAMSSFQCILFFVFVCCWSLGRLWMCVLWDCVCMLCTIVWEWEGSILVFWIHVESLWIGETVSFYCIVFVEDSARKVALFEGAGLCFCSINGDSPFISPGGK